MPRLQTLNAIRTRPVIAILRDIPADRIVPVATALYEGGIRVLECTFDHNQPNYLDATCEKVERLLKAFGDKLTVGVGTVLTPEEVERADGHGAAFVVSPGWNLDVIEQTHTMGLVSIPGAFSPTDVVEAHKAGADWVKLFPANVLGPQYIEAIRAPLPHIPLLIVGGITAENALVYKNAGADGVGVGSCICPADAVSAGDWERITRLAAALTSTLAGEHL